MWSVTHGVPQDQTTCSKLIHGYIRINKPTRYFTPEIALIVAGYYIGSCSIVSAIWQISKDEIPNKEAITIKGPELVINNYKFRLKLTRVSNTLYFGIWYQESQQIQKALFKHFATKSNKKTASRIVNSFNDGMKGQELDEILFDLEDINESSILSHVEKELKEAELLGDHQMHQMKQDMVDIIEDQISFMFNYNISVHGQNKTQSFRKLNRFNTIQLMEQKTEIAITDDAVMKFEIDLEVFDDEHYVGYQKYEKEVSQEWDVMKNSLINIKQGEIIYFDNFSLFTIFINKDNGLYYVYLQQYKPNFYNELDPMMISIDQVKLYVDNMEIFKARDLSLTADKYALCGIIKSSLLSGSNLLNMAIRIKWY